MSKKPTSASTQKKRPAKGSSRTFPRIPYYLVIMPLIIMIWGFIYMRTGEIIGVDGGCGWDGSAYADIVFKFDQYMADASLDSYRIQRIVPSAIVHYILKSQNILPYRENTVYYFYVYNLWILTACGLLWALIARRLRLSVMLRWLGFVGLFVNFAVMKYSFYYPPLTDQTAVFLCLCAIYCYLLDSSVAHAAQLLVAAVGFFTWPTAFYVSMVLFLFPRKQPTTDLLATETNKTLGFVLTAVITLFAAVAMWYLSFVKQLQFPGTDALFQPTIYLGATLVLAYIAASMLPFARTFPYVQILRFFTTRQFALRFVCGAVVAIALWFFKQSLCNPAAPLPMTTELFFGGSFSAAIGKPLLPLVANVVYFGPILLVAALLYKDTVRGAAELGVGFMLIVAGTVLLSSIMTESRQLINLYPFVVIACIKGLERVRVNTLTVWIIATLSLVSTKIWMPLNFPGMQEYVYGGGSRFTFPLQKYFMNQGPYMSLESYIYQGIAVALAALVLAGILYRYWREQKTLPKATQIS